VAVDAGPRGTLRPIADHVAATLEPTASSADDAHWRDSIARRRPSLLIVGTSDSAAGRAIEASARRAARAAKLPIVAVEDFPGNYTPVADGDADLVVVESAAAREIYLHRLGSNAPATIIAAPARYDAYRRELASLRSATASRWRAPGRRPTVLWAGQPETAYAVKTLEVLAPVLRRHTVRLLFKAHPRDPGYTGGVYRPLLATAGVDFTDVTPLGVVDALAQAPQLVVTQFSSVAVEAGFFGIPALCVLLPDAGGAHFLQKTGTALPPFCTGGASALCTERPELDRAFAAALNDDGLREALLRAFDSYFGVHAPAAPALVERLRAGRLKAQ